MKAGRQSIPGALNEAVVVLLSAGGAVLFAEICFAIRLDIAENILLCPLKHVTKGKIQSKQISVILIDLLLKLLNGFGLYCARDGSAVCIMKMEVVVTVTFTRTIWECEIVF